MTTIVFSKLVRQPINVFKTSNRANPMFSVRLFSSKAEPRVFVKGGIVIERHPVVYPLPNQLEAEYFNLKEQIKKDREDLREAEAQARYAEEMKIRAVTKSKAQAKKQAKVEKEVQEAKAAMRKDKDELTPEEEEAAKKPEKDDLGAPVDFPRDIPRITPHDKSDNRRSPYRKLEESLFLVVKNNNKWQFPQLPYEDAKDKKNIRLTVERQVKLLSDNMDVHILGNSPFAFWKTDLSADEKKKLNADVSKVFLFPALYIGGDVVADQKEIQDYAWASREQLSEYFDKEFYDYIKYALSIPTHLLKSEQTDVNLYK